MSKVSDWRGRYWSRIDSNTLSGWCSRGLVDRGFKQAIVSFTLECVEGVQAGDADQEVDDKRRLADSSQFPN